MFSEYISENAKVNDCDNLTIEFEMYSDNPLYINLLDYLQTKTFFIIKKVVLTIIDYRFSFINNSEKLVITCSINRVIKKDVFKKFYCELQTNKLLKLISTI